MAEQPFDVFMCHNGEDKPAVIRIAEQLQTQGIQPWLDEWELRPGLDWQVALEAQIEQIKTAAVFVGPAGLGPWQVREMQAFLREFVERGCPVIPVLLPDAPAEPKLPTFLRGKTWVDFRRESPEPFGRLVWGITGVKPGTAVVAVEQKDVEQKAAEQKIVEPIVTTRTIVLADSFEDQYLACQASDVQALRSEGAVQHDGIFVPLLRDVFVPLTLDLSANSPGFRGLLAEGPEEMARSYSVWDFLAKAGAEKTFRQLAILAWGGYGKTTLLKHIAYRLGTKQPEKGVPQKVPFLLVLRKYRALLSQENPPSLPELISEHHVKSLAGAKDLQVPADWAVDVLTQGRALVMFDGFDEMAKAQRPAVAKWLNEQMRQYGESVFIVTARPKAYKEQDAAARLVLASSLWVKDFDSEQRRDFVTRWYDCQERYANAGRETPDVKKRAAEFSQDLLEQIEAQPELKALAKNPLLLNMIVTFHRRYQGANLPKRRVELYREICQLQLRDRPRARRLETLLTVCDAQTILQWVAFEMMVQKLERVEKTRLLELVGEALAEQEEALTAQDFLEPVVEVSELIVQQEDEYEFSHLSFQEYLAAAYVAAESAREGLLYDHLQEDWWKPTILLYSGLVNPTKLIREAMRQDLTDIAYACLQETRKRVDEGLKAQLQSVRDSAAHPLDGINIDYVIAEDSVVSAELHYGSVVQIVLDSRYADLSNYLKNRQWKEADDETYRLMITEVGKETGQIFDREDLLNFPCEPLKVIDGLWVKHSNGKFGFSVQKKIYLECGGILDGKYYADAWNKLCFVSGWDSRINYDLNAPSGHIPFSYSRRTFQLYGGRRVVQNAAEGARIEREDAERLELSLFSRIQTCTL
ncbi:MAG: GUN4 domain-containing protein [Cyanobacteria bacterium J06634_5]